MKNITKKIVLAISALSLAATSQAQVIYLNMGAETITNWNNISVVNADISAGSVIDSNGAILPGVSINTGNFNGSFTNSGSYGSGGSVPSWMQSGAEITTWYRGFSVIPGIVEFTGLDPASIYQVDLVAVRSTGPDNRDGYYLLNDVEADSSPSSLLFNAYSNGWIDGDVITWNNITGTDTLKLSMTGSTSSDYGYATAIRISTIPEPSTTAFLILFGIASACLLVRRRMIN